MAWYDNAVFYHIYPLGMTGAPKENSYGEPVERLNQLIPWISHIKNIGCNALYIGPLFESVGHGYETTDYRKLDSRLGTNETLKKFVAECHAQGVKVIFDGVFNHTGRDFFAFKDIKQNRENSQYKDWYCNVNFWNNNEYNDGFTYDNWGGYNLLAKLNQKNPAVKDYICDVIRFWVQEFDVDGIRLDAADVLDFDFMKALRQTANEVKPEFWLMGEVIHGDYIRWANESTLHSVTNYHLHKALYSGHNDHNFFEIAHTVKRLYEMGGNRPDGLKLYNFVDNHDVERIYTKLSNKAQFAPVHILMYTLPGIPSIYYGSEFGIEGRKEKFSDDSLRPEMSYDVYGPKAADNDCVKLISALGKIRQNTKELNFGDYKELRLTNRQYAFSRSYQGSTVIVAVNNDENGSSVCVSAPDGEYIGALSGRKINASGGNLNIDMAANSGDIWVPEASCVNCELGETCEVAQMEFEAVEQPVKEEVAEVKAEAVAQANIVEVKAETAQAVAAVEACADKGAEVVEKKAESNAVAKAEATIAGAEELAKKGEPVLDLNKPYEEMNVAELQEVILGKMRRNGTPMTEQIIKSVRDNEHLGSLVSWAKSF